MISHEKHYKELDGYIDHFIATLKLKLEEVRVNIGSVNILTGAYGLDILHRSGLGQQVGKVIHVPTFDDMSITFERIPSPYSIFPISSASLWAVVGNDILYRQEMVAEQGIKDVK